jgi:hypothetical protein
LDGDRESVDSPALIPRFGGSTLLRVMAGNWACSG